MEAEFKSRYWYRIKVILCLALACIAIFYFPDLILIIFGGLLFSIFLSGVSDFLKQKTGIGYGWCLAAVLILSTGATALTWYYFAPDLAEQFNQLTKEVPKALTDLSRKLSQYSWAQDLREEASPKNIFQSSPDLLKSATNIFGNTLEWISNIFIMAFLGLYGAIEPNTYRKGFLKLFPKEKRPRMECVLREANETLRWWLIGKFFGMAVIGIMTFIGLLLMDVPLALALALIAAFLTFIPNIGPILAALPAVLLGFVEGPDKALTIALLYIGIQTVESYLLTPFVQRKTISLPPALTLSAQVIFGYSVGGIGVAFATPVTALAIVLVRMLYIEDRLNDTV